MVSLKGERESASCCVVIPARNEEKTFPATLKMLNAQTLCPRVIITIDDGSTDKTAEIAKKMNYMM